MADKSNYPGAQRWMGDVVALSALPVLWVGRDEHQIAKDIADSLFSTLRASFVYVGLQAPSSDGFVLEVARREDGFATAREARELGTSLGANLKPKLELRSQPVLVPDPLGNGSIWLIAKTLGCGPRFGVIALARPASSPPTEFDLALLSIGANQATIGLEHCGLISELSHSRHELSALVESLRQGEQEYRAMFELAGAGTAQVHPSGRFLRVNRKCCEITGYSTEELVTMRFSEITHPDDLPWELAQFERLLRGEIAEHSSEKRYIRKDGSIIWVHVTATLVRKPNGEALHTVKVIEDVNERKRAEAELKNLNERLEQRVAERTSEASRRAEQLRALAFQLAGAEYRQSRRLAQMLHDDLQQLLVTGKLRLALARARAPSDLQHTLTEVDEVFAQSLQCTRTLTGELSPPALRQPGFTPVLNSLAKRAREKHGLNVELRVNGPEPGLADELKVTLFESIRELLFNVTKHAGVSTARVLLNSSESGSLRIMVEDKGAGFDSTSFEPDQHGGFGLFSIRERMELLGGALEIDSQPGKGTVVTLIAPTAAIPVSEASTLEPSAAAHVEHLAPCRASASSPIRVLVADDHTMVRQGLRSIIESQSDIEVIGEASNGREAISLALSLKPDVVIMDVSMPELDGVEATRVLTQQKRELHVIGLSMYDQEEVLTRMSAAGALRCLSKDAASEMLCDAIRQAVANEKLHLSVPIGDG